MNNVEKVLVELSGILDLPGDFHHAYHMGRYELFSVLKDENKNTIKTAVRRLLSAGKIEKEIINGQIHYKITSQGWDKLNKRINLKKLQQKKWDKLWRVVIFDISEERRGKRDVLRDKLKYLGFGQLQRSVWINPYNFLEEIQELLEHKNLTEGTLLFEAKRIGKRSDKEIAEEAWPLWELSEKYEDAIWHYQEAAKKKPEKAAYEFNQSYAEILQKDPCLPKKLLPSYWKGHQAAKLYPKVRPILLEKQS